LEVESHTPKIEAPDTVKVGETIDVKIVIGPHLNTVQYSIRWIELYFYKEGRAFNPILLGRVMFIPEYTEPEVMFRVKLRKSGVLYAIEYCNLHGLWEGRKEIKVE